ncbi:hypothetical protein C8Q73DRAFT_680720 [Cubamyces lactineus]|nr:hypothetical protein C8Q73DRAFT_680720 [Cubamyces lactineus]
MATTVYVHSLDQASGMAPANASHAFFAVASPPTFPLQIGLRVQLFLSSLAGHPQPAPNDPLTIVTPVYFTGKIVAERMEHSNGREYLAYNDDRAAPIQRAFIRAVPGRGEAVTTDIAAAVSVRLTELIKSNPTGLAPEPHPTAEDAVIRLPTPPSTLGSANTWSGYKYAPLLSRQHILPTVSHHPTRIVPEESQWLWSPYQYSIASSQAPASVPYS